MIDYLHKLPNIGPKIDAIIKSPYTVTICQDTSKNPGDAANPDHIPPTGSTIPWNPQNNIDFEHTAKTENPYARMAHELSHAYDFINGQGAGSPYIDADGQSRPAPGEQEAVRAENAAIRATTPVGPPAPDFGGVRTTYNAWAVPNP